MKKISIGLFCLVLFLCLSSLQAKEQEKLVDFTIVQPSEGSTVNPGQAVSVVVYAYNSVAGIQSISSQGDGDTKKTQTYNAYPPTTTVTEYFTYNVPYSVTPGQELTITVEVVDYVDGLFKKYRHVNVAGSVTPTFTPTPTPSPTPGDYTTTQIQSPNPSTWAEFGNAVDGVPDFTGDGCDDVVVGCYRESYDWNGAAYIFNGKTGACEGELVSPNDQNYGYFGWDVAGVPDADGDGRGDILVSGENENLSSEPDASGLVYLYSGQTGNVLHTFTSDETDVINFGWSVSGVSDLNGDGRGDVIVGSPAEDLPGYLDRAGRIYVFDGATGSQIWKIESPNKQYWGLFGGSVAGVPDLTGDGYGDIIVGADEEDISGYTESGRVYVFDGFTSALIHTITSPDPENWGNFGENVAGVPDVDGDGLGDIIVSTTEQDPYVVYVFSGADASLIYTLHRPEEGGGGSFADSIAGVNDIDGDGLGEIIVGSPNWLYYGRVIIFSGRTGRVLFSISPTHAGFYSDFPYDVGGITDANGNSLGDLVAGDTGEEVDDKSDAGVAYIYHFHGPFLKAHPECWIYYE